MSTDFTPPDFSLTTWPWPQGPPGTPASANREPIWHSVLFGSVQPAVHRAICSNHVLLSPLLSVAPNCVSLPNSSPKCSRYSLGPHEATHELFLTPCLHHRPVSTLSARGSLLVLSRNESQKEKRNLRITLALHLLSQAPLLFSSCQSLHSFLESPRESYDTD